MLLADLARASGRPLPRGSPNPDIAGLSADSRAVAPGFLFAALPGARADGAGFLDDALARGAAAVLAPPGAAVRRARGRGVAAVADRDPRRRLARMAAAFHGAQPATVAAVTGTNGKTSIAHFLAAIWRAQGLRAAAIGTLGVQAPGVGTGGAGGLTTPDPVALHAGLARLAAAGVGHAVLEASSHGLAQRRLDGVRIRCGVLGTVGRDHLDYHGTVARYRAAKRRLFGELVEPGGAAVLNADAPGAPAFCRAAARRGLRVVAYGRGAGAAWRIESSRPAGDGQELGIRAPGGRRAVAFPLIGGFQAENALAAAAAAAATGTAEEEALGALAALDAPAGRLERVARHRGAAAYVDYAHTPDALAAALAALRPHVAGRIHLVFGCGGDRDPGKRVLMGRAAARGADEATVTDDNPRTEDPARIRAEVLRGCPGAREEGDRRAAIRGALARLAPGDALLVAGKGHEAVQERGAEALPFDDREVVRGLAEEPS